MSEQAVHLRCQRIGCNATFTLDHNPEGSCVFHDSGPIFHDGMKEWSCCKKKSHDFSLFMDIPGCKTGKHTTEKPVLTKAAPRSRNPTPVPSPISASTTATSAKETCSRCRQGFFCSDHGSQPNPKPVVPQAVAAAEVIVNASAPPRKTISITEPQICKNKGCGQTFKEIDNHDTACNYHPGPAVFHDRMRGWKCCDVHVKEFDEFMSIPPCTQGWHNADPSS
ncbi:cysteine and histidine-rich domain-containing protein RAR1-like [Chenopodium quinoa]|uniref:cysteine and histidine-rich domain-containing protein RAR1-like n=1 Tax=Chenopodium quinoa TaxID=63459 RepID=UPI000B77D331|nr:cysteine and histidine-rich domain-containing protein RAR1-like [Chenopodium quinoa]